MVRLRKNRNLKLLEGTNILLPVSAYAEDGTLLPNTEYSKYAEYVAFYPPFSRGKEQVDKDVDVKEEKNHEDVKVEKKDEVVKEENNNEVVKEEPINEVVKDEPNDEVVKKEEDDEVVKKEEDVEVVKEEEDIEVEGSLAQASPVKRRKQHKRKTVENQEPCLMRGVYYKNMKWQAAIKVDKKQIHLGTVNSQLEAARLYDRAAFKCGRDTNFELTEAEKIELVTCTWGEFLARTRRDITHKKGRRRIGAEVPKTSEASPLDNEDSGDNDRLSSSEDPKPETSEP